MAFSYLTLDVALRIHEILIEAFGGAREAWDPGLIEAALLRPQTGYYRDLTEEAAALWESLAMNHGFIDGNTRVDGQRAFVHDEGDAGYLVVISDEAGVAPEAVEDAHIQTARRRPLPGFARAFGQASLPSPLGGEGERGQFYSAAGVPRLTKPSGSSWVRASSSAASLASRWRFHIWA